MTTERPDFPDEVMDTGIGHLCKDGTCPEWRRCYRFRAIPNSASRYFDRSPRSFYPKRIGGCDYRIEFDASVPVLSEAELNGL